MEVLVLFLSEKVWKLVHLRVKVNLPSLNFWGLSLADLHFKGWYLLS